MNIEHQTVLITGANRGIGERSSMRRSNARDASEKMNAFRSRAGTARPLTSRNAALQREVLSA
jgi:NAD(P)-dependent dehydrogenase (short-subunit alcohol dehydrogenase family)